MSMTRKLWRTGNVVVLLLLLPNVGSAGNRPVFKMILELAPEDTASIAPQLIIAECSKYLKGKEEKLAENVAGALSRRGEAYLLIGDTEAALMDYDSLCELTPRDARAHGMRARFWRSGGT